MGTMGDLGLVALEVVGGAPGGLNGALANRNGHIENGLKSNVKFLALWESHSVFDVWLVIAAGQIGFLFVTMPYSLSQMGYAWGILACILYGILGAWTMYILVWLYLEFKSRLDLQGKVRPKKYILQVKPNVADGLHAKPLQLKGGSIFF